MKFICSRLDEFGIAYVVVPKGGVIGFIGGDENSKTVMLRADMDALTIQESECNLAQKKPVLSEVPGVAHLCGHDGHTAMLLGAAKILQQMKEELPGRVLLFFERSEEAGGKILYMLRYLYEHKIRVDGAFAMHVNPRMQTGKLSLDYGPITSGGYGFEVTVHGQGGHGSAPDKCNSPIDCFAAIYQAVTSIPVKYISAKEVCSFNFGKVQSGSKRNIIPDSLDFAGGFRFYRHDVGWQAKNTFLRLIDGVCKTYDCTYEVTNAVGPTLPVVNVDQCVEIGRRGIAKYLGDDVREELGMESFSESFASATAFYPTAFGMLGITNPALGSGAELHNPAFDLDEAALPLGVAFHISYALSFLENTDPIPFTPYAGSPDDLFRDICYHVD